MSKSVNDIFLLSIPIGGIGTLIISALLSLLSYLSCFPESFPFTEAKGTLPLYLPITVLRVVSPGP